jgi:hypothetical protein
MQRTLSSELLAALRKLRASAGWSDDITASHDAFLLYGGMGSAMYVTSDGRFLLDGSGWDDSPLRESNDDEAIASLVIGAKRTGITALLNLVPPAPSTASTCTTCNGSRWEMFGGPDNTAALICSKCWGRGWVIPGESFGGFIGSSQTGSALVQANELNDG